MNLIDRIGSDTITRLERAANQRVVEAACLMSENHWLTAIYLCGYSAEMVIGSAYFRLLGYSENQPIDEHRRWVVLRSAGQRIVLSDKHHPLDGLARLLVADKKDLSPPGYDRAFGRSLTARVDSICRHWSPRLRYRDIDAAESQAREVIEASRWLLAAHPQM